MSVREVGIQRDPIGLVSLPCPTPRHVRVVGMTLLDIDRANTDQTPAHRRCGLGRIIISELFRNYFVTTLLLGLVHSVISRH